MPASTGTAGHHSGEKPLEDLLDEAAESGEAGRVTVGTLLDKFGRRSFGPLIVVFALIVLLPPLGAIPGVPTTIGSLVFLLALQLLFLRKTPWVPRFLREFGVREQKVRDARKKGDGVLSAADAMVGERLGWATGALAQWFAALCMAALALTMPPLELLPFAAAAPAAAILMFGLAITARDGLLMLIGFALTLGAGYLAWSNAGRIAGFFTQIVEWVSGLFG